MVTQISEAFEVLSDKNKRTVYDQFGEEGLKGRSPTPGARRPGASAFPGGTTYTFTSSGTGGFSPTDPAKIFEYAFNSRSRASY